MKEYNDFYLDKLLPELGAAGVNLATNFMDTDPSNGLLSGYPYKKRTGFPTQSPNYGDSHYGYYLL
jgi:hypothetical protein